MIRRWWTGLCAIVGIATTLAMAVGFAVAVPATAEETGTSSPIGRWKTFDDHTGQPRGIVRIYAQDGKLFGRIEHSFEPGADARRCVECTDERRGQPIVGLVVIRNLSPEGGEYRGGDILDPDSGVVYRCKLQIEDGGRKLRVRGYYGISLLGRTQVWERLAAD